MGISIKELKHVAEAVLGCEREKDADHVRYILRVNKRIIGNFKYSHSWRGNFQVPDKILGLQAKTMNCSAKTWKQLLQGNLTKEEYFTELLERNVINQAEFDVLCKKEESRKNK